MKFKEKDVHFFLFEFCYITLSFYIWRIHVSMEKMKGVFSSHAWTHKWNINRRGGWCPRGLSLFKTLVITCIKKIRIFTQFTHGVVWLEGVNTFPLQDIIPISLSSECGLRVRERLDAHLGWESASGLLLIELWLLLSLERKWKKVF